MKYDNLKLEKGMYTVSGRSFTGVLEELDPSEHYQGTPMEGLDAFERQLKRFDIKVAGGRSDPLEKFFSTSTSAALFPEYVKRAVMTGAEEFNILNSLVATKTQIDSLDYRSITSNPTKDERELKVVAEGARIPVTQVRTQENLVKLQKRGRMLDATYEAIRFQKLDLFTVTLRQIGAQIARQQLGDAVEVLINGDGNNNPAEVLSLAGSEFAYQDLLNLWGRFEEYGLNTLVTNTAGMMKLLALKEFQDPATGLNFQATGKLTTPLGADLYRTSSVPGGKLIGLDRSCALEMVVAGEIGVEYDKLIDRQMERAAITATTGFAKIFPGAVKVLTL